MYISHLRYIKYLHWSKTLIVFLVVLFSTNNFVSAQKIAENRKIINLPNFDERRMHFGFYLAGNYATYRIKRSEFTAQNPDSIISVNPTGTPGFTLGFIFNLRLNDYADLRLVPGVAFYERDVDYNFKLKGPIKQVMESTMAEFPLLLKLKSERRGNTRMYVIFGGKYSMASGLRRKDKKPEELRAVNSDVSVEYGFGFDIYYEYFKLSPEIRFSHGLKQAFVDDPNKYANALSRLNTHTVTISFHFQ